MSERVGDRGAGRLAEAGGFPRLGRPDIEAGGAPADVEAAGVTASRAESPSWAGSTTWWS